MQVQDANQRSAAGPAQHYGAADCGVNEMRWVKMNANFLIYLIKLLDVFWHVKITLTPAARKAGPIDRYGVPVRLP
jgi:hypothetical protein